MSGLFSSLDASVQALNAQSYAINVSGKNLANVNNENYTQERVVFGSNLGTTINAQGAENLGEETTSVEQDTNPLLEAQLAQETSISSSYQTQQQYLEQAQTALGESVTNSSATSGTSGTDTGSTGLSAAIDGFFNDVQSLAASPTDSGQRATLYQQASVLTSTFQLVDGNLAQVQSGLTGEIQSDVSDANTQLTTIASLNKQIKLFEAGSPGSAVDLRDERQAAIQQLATDVPITSTIQSDGSVQISMTGTSGGTVVLVNGLSVTGPLSFSGSTLTGGAASSGLRISSGAIYGAQQARDGEVQTMRTNLNGLTSQMVTSVNAAYNPSATVGGDFFDPSGTTAATMTLATGLTANSISAGTGAAGDNSTALAVAAVANQVFSTAGGDSIDGTISGYYSGAVSALGEALSNMNNLVTNQTAVQTLVQSQRDNVSGVSLDEEMGNLMKYQNAYQASARVFSTINDMLATLINNLGSAG